MNHRLGVRYFQRQIIICLELGRDGEEALCVPVEEEGTAAGRDAYKGFCVGKGRMK